MLRSAKRKIAVMYKFRELDISRIERNHQLAVSLEIQVKHIVLGDFGAINDPYQCTNQLFDVIHRRKSCQMCYHSSPKILSNMLSFIVANPVKYVIDQSADGPIATVFHDKLRK
jgi:hypothetical protein